MHETCTKHSLKVRPLLALAFIACVLAFIAIAPRAAFADDDVTPTKLPSLTLGIDEISSRLDFSYYSGGDNYLTLESSNEYVADVVRDYGTGDDCDYTFVRVLGKKPGTAKIEIETGYETTDEDGNPEYVEIGEYYVYVTVKSYGKLCVSQCDALFSGSKYSISSLLFESWSDYGCVGNGYTFFKSTGKFVSGTGYKVYNSGKYIAFTKAANNVKVKFKQGGKTYTIYVARVHSKAYLLKYAKSYLKKIGATYKSASFYQESYYSKTKYGNTVVNTNYKRGYVVKCTYKKATCAAKFFYVNGKITPKLVY